MSEFHDFTSRRDLRLASIDSLALLSYLVDACAHGAGISAAELCTVAKDFGLMIERPLVEGEDFVEGAIPGDLINAFAEHLRIDLSVGRQRVAERYRSDKH